MRKILFCCACVLVIHIKAQIISTVAGNGTNGFTGDGGQAIVAEIANPSALCLDAAGNIYMTTNNRVRKVSTSGIITTVAGNGTFGFAGDGGAATAAQLNDAISVAIDPAGNIYIADYLNNRIRKVNTTGIISTIAGNGTASFGGDGGPATAAQLNHPWGVALDAAGNLYISDYANNRIRKVNTSGIISTVAGNGTQGFAGDGGLATAAQLNSPAAVCFDASGNMYIPDLGNNRIRTINSSGIINTIAGNGIAGYLGDGGSATAAELNGPSGIAIDAAGNIYIADENNSAVRMVNGVGIINTVAGIGVAGYCKDGDLATVAELNNPQSIALDVYANLFIADFSNNRIRTVCNAPDTISGLISEPNAQPVNAGAVYVFRKQVQHMGLLDTAGFANINPNGTYTFQALPYGSYFVQAAAAASYTNAVSTYYSNKANNYRWDSAIFVNHHGCMHAHYTGYNITVLEFPVHTGTGIISGTVTALPGYGLRLGGNNSVMGAPLKGVDIKLGKNPSGSIDDRTMSNTSGTYTFTNVDTGNYSIYVDIPNFGMDTILKVHLTASNPNSLNNNYCVDSARVRLCSPASGINELLTENSWLRIYPNPAYNILQISTGENNPDIESIRLYDLLGNEIRPSFFDTVTGGKTAMDIKWLPEGIYIISIKCGQGRINKKVVIAR